MDFWWGGLLLSFVLGACVGSFLNVAIYRVPRGLSVNDPPRSYCPQCQQKIPWYRNLPLLTWVLQGGRSSCCEGKIPVRYLLVEGTSAVLFALVWALYPGPHALVGMLFVALLTAISFIDAEHYVIPVHWCWGGAAAALLASFFFPQLVALDGMVDFRSWTLGGGYLVDGSGQVIWNFPVKLSLPIGWSMAWVSSLLGWVVGYGLLIAVVILGKAAFGRKRVELDRSAPWSLREAESPEGELQFVLDGETTGWSELFHRKSDALVIEGSHFKIDGQRLKGAVLTIRDEQIICGEQRYAIAELKSVEGQAERLIIPREAMGEGDPPFLAMIGAFLGAPAVLFTLFCASFYALGAALLGRVGFGRQLPFGPFLALGGLTWLLGGWQLWIDYLRFAGF